MNLFENTYSDQEMVKAVNGLSSRILYQYRAKCRELKVIQAREKLSLSHQAILIRIVEEKKKNPQMYYTTIIDKICRQQFTTKDRILERELNAVNTVIANTVESRINDAFEQICQDKSDEINQKISEVDRKIDLFTDYFNHANALQKIIRQLGEPELAQHFASSIDMMCYSVVGRKQV